MARKYKTGKKTRIVRYVKRVKKRSSGMKPMVNKVMKGIGYGVAVEQATKMAGFGQYAQIASYGGAYYGGKIPGVVAMVAFDFLRGKPFAPLNLGVLFGGGQGGAPGGTFA